MWRLGGGAVSGNGGRRGTGSHEVVQVICHDTPCRVRRRASSNNRVISEASVNRVKKAESVASRKTGGDV
jgi:hypothetical protein